MGRNLAVATPTSSGRARPALMAAQAGDETNNITTASMRLLGSNNSVLETKNTYKLR